VRAVCCTRALLSFPLNGDDDLASGVVSKLAGDRARGLGKGLDAVDHDSGGHVIDERCERAVAPLSTRGELPYVGTGSGAVLARSGVRPIRAST
jgi:hypothetical protein